MDVVTQDLNENINTMFVIHSSQPGILYPPQPKPITFLLHHHIYANILGNTSTCQP